MSPHGGFLCNKRIHSHILSAGRVYKGEKYGLYEIYFIPIQNLTWFSQNFYILFIYEVWNISIQTGDSINAFHCQDLLSDLGKVIWNMSFQTHNSSTKNVKSKLFHGMNYSHSVILINYSGTLSEVILAFLVHKSFIIVASWVPKLFEKFKKNRIFMTTCSLLRYPVRNIAVQTRDFSSQIIY